MKNIAILASGSGTNAEEIMQRFASSESIKVALVLTDRRNAGVIERALRAGVECVYFSREEFENGEKILSLLRQKLVDFVVLAGFLKLIPQNILDAYRGRMVNIHPSLLPAYGGKGMYGMNVHRAVIAAGERQSGITIHMVDEHYDNGAIVAQHRCEVLPADTPETLAARIHSLEYKHYPQEIERLVMNLQ